VQLHYELHCATILIMRITSAPIRLLALLFLLLFNSFTGAVSAFAQPLPKGTALRIFIIGNSFSGNATTYLQQLVKEGGYKLQWGRAELGGAPLQRHWEGVAANQANDTDPKGREYKGKSLKELLSSGKYDYVTLQQYSRLSADYKTYQPYADNLVKLINELQPGAKLAVHQTWAYRADAVNWGLVDSNKAAKNDKEMYEKLKANYTALAKHLKAGFIPSGNAFWIMRNDPTWAYVPIPKPKVDTVTYPNVPVQLYSLNMGYTWDANKKWKFDPNHANVAGCYLGSLVWYHYFFGVDVNNVKFKPAGLNEDFAKRLRKAAMEAFAGLDGASK
jgi:hypothetical protein